MQILETASKLGRNRCCVRLIQLRLHNDMTKQIRSLDIVSDEIYPVIIFNDAVYLHDIRVIKPFQKINFALDHLYSIRSELNFPVNFTGLQLIRVDVLALANFVQFTARSKFFLQLVLLIEVHQAICDDGFVLGSEVHICLEAVRIACVLDLLIKVVDTPSFFIKHPRQFLLDTISVLRWA